MAPSPGLTLSDARLVAAIEAFGVAYDDDHYRVSPLLRRKGLSGASFRSTHEERPMGRGALLCDTAGTPIERDAGVLSTRKLRRRIEQVGGELPWP